MNGVRAALEDEDDPGERAYLEPLIQTYDSAVNKMERQAKMLVPRIMRWG